MLRGPPSGADATKPDWKVRRTGRLKSLPRFVWREIADILNFGVRLDASGIHVLVYFAHIV